VDDIYAQIAEELRTQFMLGYTPPKDQASGYHSIHLTAKKNEPRGADSDRLLLGAVKSSPLLVSVHERDWDLLSTRVQRIVRGLRCFAGRVVTLRPFDRAGQAEALHQATPRAGKRGSVAVHERGPVRQPCRF